MAAGAADVLETAVVSSSLYDAIADCKMVIASTVRVRGYDLPSMTPEECGGELLKRAVDGPVALMFGPERFGISNSDLAFARARVTIPANPEYSSLNLAASVQTLCYEIYKQYSLSIAATQSSENSPLPSVQELEYFYKHMETAFRETGFINRNHSGEIMQKLRRLFGKAQPDQTEINILRGMLASIGNTNNKS